VTAGVSEAGVCLQTGPGDPGDYEADCNKEVPDFHLKAFIDSQVTVCAGISGEASAGCEGGVDASGASASCSREAGYETSASASIQFHAYGFSPIVLGDLIGNAVAAIGIQSAALNTVRHSPHPSADAGSCRAAYAS
jgi:hypothetical protein